MGRKGKWESRHYYICNNGMPETGRDANERKHEDVSPQTVHHPSDGKGMENQQKLRE